MIREGYAAKDSGIADTLLTVLYGDGKDVVVSKQIFRSAILLVGKFSDVKFDCMIQSRMDFPSF